MPLCEATPELNALLQPKTNVWLREINTVKNTLQNFKELKYVWRFLILFFPLVKCHVYMESEIDTLLSNRTPLSCFPIEQIIWG